MGKGFASVKAQPEKPPTKSAKLTPISQVQANLSSYFNDIKDPRVKRTKKHLLKDILVIAILAVIAGAEGWEDIENYAQAKQQWLSEFLELPNGIPSDDTFRRIFERLEPSTLEDSFTKWIQELIPSLDKQIVPIDGKCLRGSYDREQGIKALHLVTAWVAEQNLTLGQVKVEDHSHEITAIPALLELIDIKGAIITIDAMGTQTEIVRLIRQKQAHYVLALKKNHPTLHQEVKNWFNSALANKFEGINVSHDRRVEKGHHRTEKRLVWAVAVSELTDLYQQGQWSGLQTIVMVERTRHLWNKVTHQVQFYLSSLPADAQNLGNAIRTHWGIENQVHWTLDVTLRCDPAEVSSAKERAPRDEDHCRIRSGHSPRNLALLRRIALNALNQEKSLKRSLRQKMKRAAMNNDYMMTVLQSFCQ